MVPAIFKTRFEVRKGKISPKFSRIFGVIQIVHILLNYHSLTKESKEYFPIYKNLRNISNKQVVDIEILAEW